MWTRTAFLGLRIQIHRVASQSYIPERQLHRIEDRDVNKDNSVEHHGCTKISSIPCQDYRVRTNF